MGEGWGSWLLVRVFAPIVMKGNFHKYFSRLAFLSQARRTRQFARSARRALIATLLLPSSRASRKMQRSPCLAHKAPVMQARSRAIFVSPEWIDMLYQDWRDQ